MINRGDTFKVCEVCPESGVYRLKYRSCTGREGCHSENQREIPLTKGKRFPPCRNCKGEVVWKYVRRA